MALFFLLLPYVILRGIALKFRSLFRWKTATDVKTVMDPYLIWSILEVVVAVPPWVCYTKSLVDSSGIHLVGFNLSGKPLSLRWWIINRQPVHTDSQSLYLMSYTDFMQFICTDTVGLYYFTIIVVIFYCCVFLF